MKLTDRLLYKEAKRTQNKKTVKQEQQSLVSSSSRSLARSNEGSKGDQRETDRERG